MNPRRFLLIAGLLLVLLGLLGFLGFGPTASQSLLGVHFYLDMGENLLHLLFGAAVLLAYAFVRHDQTQRYLIMVLGGLALIATIAGFLNAGNVMPNLGWTNLENPSDNLLHFILGVWALWVAFMPEGPLFVRDEPRA